MARDEDSFHRLIVRMATDKVHQSRVRDALSMEGVVEKLFERDRVVQTWVSFLHRAVRSARQECDSKNSM